MTNYKCKICHDYGQVHPIIKGFVQYNRTVYCKCQGDKAGKTATPPISPARLSYMVDYFNAGLNDYLHQSGCGRIMEVRTIEPQQDLTPIKDELEIINNRLNEIPTPVKKQSKSAF